MSAGGAGKEKRLQSHCHRGHEMTTVESCHQHTESLPHTCTRTHTHTHTHMHVSYAILPPTPVSDGPELKAEATDDSPSDK